MTNPLLTPFSLPPFSAIKPEHVVPAVTKALEDCRAAVESAVAHGAPYSWENLCQPLAEVDDVLGRIFSPISHLNSVKNSPELREAYEQTLPLLSEYSTWVGQHEGLYQAYRDLRDGDADIVAAAINQLIRWTVELNWPSTEPPIYSFWDQEAQDALQASRDKSNYDAGARFTNAYFMRAYGYQEGDLAAPARRHCA